MKSKISKTKKGVKPLPFSDEHKRRMSLSAKRSYKNGRISAFKDKRHTLETRLKLSLIRKGRKGPTHEHLKGKHLSKTKIAQISVKCREHTEAILEEAKRFYGLGYRVLICDKQDYAFKSIEKPSIVEDRDE